MEPITDHNTPSGPINSHITTVNAMAGHSIPQKELNNSPLVTSSESASSQINGSSVVLGLSQKDNQAVFTLNAPSSIAAAAGSDVSPLPAVDSQQFQSIENRRSKLLETFTVRTPDLDSKAKPVMEVKPRSTSSSTVVNSANSQAKHVSAGLKVALPKPTVKPKPSKKPSANTSQQSE